MLYLFGFVCFVTCSLVSIDEFIRRQLLVVKGMRTGHPGSDCLHLQSLTPKEHPPCLPVLLWRANGLQFWLSFSAQLLCSGRHSDFSVASTLAEATASFASDHYRNQSAGQLLEETVPTAASKTTSASWRLPFLHLCAVLTF